jgi:hypothetical protein
MGKGFTARHGAVGAFALLLLSHGSVAAQRQVEDTTRWVFGLSRWTLEVHGGAGTFGRFLLEAPTAATPDEEREVTADNGFAIGGAIGATVLPRTAVRLSYTYTKSDFVYRDDSGTGSDALDVDDLGGLATHVVSGELTRFLVAEANAIVPYASAGFLASWWSLEEAASGIRAPGGTTQLRWGGIATLGLQFHLSTRFRARLEAATASVRNPFRGSDSFITADGVTIDEPNRVSKTDYRIVIVYVLGG